MTEIPEGPAPRRPGAGRWLVPALIVSLALNALLGGVLAGRSWRDRAERPEEGVTLLRAMRHGPPPAREAARAVAAERGPAFEALRAEAHAARAAAADAARAEPFERAALDAALARLAEVEARLGALLHAAFADLVARLDGPARAALLERFARGEGRRGHGERRGDRGEDAGGGG